ncbi:MAG: alpha/beta fold hydrolase [Solirubrobacteraceae bacterium]
MTLTDEGLIPVPGLASRYVRLASGARAHYMTAGDSGPYVVLLHGGIPGSSGVAGWRFMAPFLAEHGFRVFCPDQPGFGLSDPRREHWPIHGIYSHVEFLHQFADALCLDEFFLAGNSMGCIVTTHYVTAHPDRVTRFACIAGGIGDHDPLDLAKPRQAIGWNGTPEMMRAMMKLITCREEAISDELIEMRVNFANRNNDAWQSFWDAFALGGMSKDLEIALSTRERINRLSVPGVYLYGLDDEILPAEKIGFRQEDMLPNVQFFYPSECGHQGQSDQPELFNQLFLEFFRDGRVTRATADRAGVSKRRAESPALVKQVEAAIA